MSTDTPRVRTSDAERERIAETLRAAVGEGRLTLEEGDERLATLYTTKFRDELGSLVADLPNTDDAARRGGRGRGRPGPDDTWTPDATDEHGYPRRGPGGPPWAAGTGQGDPAAGGWGGPGWNGPGWGRGPRPPWFLVPLLPLLLVFLTVAVVGGVAHGHFFAFLPLVFIALLVARIFGFRRRWGGWRR